MAIEETGGPYTKKELADVEALKRKGKKPTITGTSNPPHTPHKYAEVIKAWADGETIEYRRIGEPVWHDCTGNQTVWWSPDYEYRLKPVPATPVPAVQIVVAELSCALQMAISSQLRLEKRRQDFQAESDLIQSWRRVLKALHQMESNSVTIQEQQ